MRSMSSLAAAAIAAFSVLLTSTATAEPWVRGYVVDTYEPAFWYGGHATSDGPGSDCPAGTIPDIFAKSDYVLSPDSTEKVPKKEISARGFDPHINTYANPFAAPDEGMREVTGHIAMGFNLDGDSRTGFTGPDGESGIDNSLYKVEGCTLSWRGVPGRGQLAEISNGQMHSGLYTFVIRISGNDSPENDSHAIVEAGWSPDPLLLGGTSAVLPGVSFRMAKNARYSRLEATVRNNMVEVGLTPEIRIPDHAYCEGDRGESVLYKGRMRLQMSADGSELHGLIGGYRDWVFLYQKDNYQAPCNAPQTRETLQHQSQIGLYYSLQRNADGIPDPKTGRNTAISTAYLITGRHAHVIDPEVPVMVIDRSTPEVAAKIAKAGEYQRRSTEAIKSKSLVGVPFSEQ